MIDKTKINIVGLGHPTRWHVSLNQDWGTEKEAIDVKNDLLLALQTHENTCYISEEEFNRPSTDEEIKDLQEAEDYYKSVSNDAKFILERRLNELKKEIELEEKLIQSYLTNNTVMEKPRKQTPYRDIIIKELEGLLKKSW